MGTQRTGGDRATESDPGGTDRGEGIPSAWFWGIPGRFQESMRERESEVAESCPTLCYPWTVACQASSSIRFSRQEYWSELPFPSPGDLPNLGTEPRSPTLHFDISSFIR